MNLRFFVQTDPFLLFMVLLGWGHALVSLGFLLSAFIGSRRVATVVG